MNTPLSKIEQEMLALPVESRVYLVDRLIESLAKAPSLDVESCWLEEAERRWRDLEEGRVEAIPAEQVMRDAQAALKPCE